MPDKGSLAAYLRQLRTRMDAAALGYGGRRRTLGLRREEVAARAGMSANWYSWLEQGRGGPPSAEALDRLASALMLNEAEREHLYLLGLGRTPEVRYQSPAAVTPRMQRVLDALDGCPALIRTATWDIIAWNRAASVVLCDYEALPVTERNVLRLMFLDPRRRAMDLDWQRSARIVVGAFRGEAVRTGAVAIVQPLVDELRARSPDFAAIWRACEVHAACEGDKRLRHPDLGDLALEFSAFSVDGRTDLVMLLYTPLSSIDRDRIRRLASTSITGTARSGAGPGARRRS